MTPSADRVLHETLRDHFFSDDPARRQQAVQAMQDFCRLKAREEGLQLPIAMIDGVIPVYANDFATPKGKPWPDVRRLLAHRVHDSPFAIPDVYFKEYETVLARRAPESAKLLKELVARATAEVLATQDRRIASLILDGTYWVLKRKLEELLAAIPWQPPPAAVDGAPAA